MTIPIHNRDKRNEIQQTRVDKFSDKLEYAEDHGLGEEEKINAMQTKMEQVSAMLSKRDGRIDQLVGYRYGYLAAGDTVA
jgi:hypothetical protein